MIQFYADTIDQLDFVLDQFEIDDRNHDRFAIMLVDNVVELTLHEFAKTKAEENRMWRFMGEWKHDPKIVKDGLSRSFFDKARAARRLGFISQEVQDSVVALHDYRNTAHHAGLRHDGILRSMGLFYFHLACEILEEFEPSSWTWTGTDRYSDRAQKYLDNPERLDAPTKYVAAFRKLKAKGQSIEQDLIDDLGRDVDAMVDLSDEMLDFLASAHPSKMSRNEATRDAHAWTLALSDKGHKYAANEGQEIGHPAALAKWLLDNYPSLVKIDPVPRWRERCNRIKQAKNRHVALRKYRDFIQQTDFLREAIEESATQLDLHIQQQIDQARGK